MTRSLQAVAESTTNGWRALHLASEALEVVVLPDKGADIYAIIDLDTGLDPLFKTPWGLKPPHAPPQPGSDDVAFLESYEGGWQELFPNTNDPARYRGSVLPFHGEVAALPWSWSVVQSDPGETGVRFEVECRLTPFRLERTMRLRDGERRLLLDERVTNLSDESAQFCWGHHCVVGPLLVAEGAELRVPSRTIITGPEPWEQTARLTPGQRGQWPVAQCRAAEPSTCRTFPGRRPEAMMTCSSRT